MLDPGIIELEVKDKWPESLCTVTIFFSGKYDLIQLHRQIIHQNDGIIHEKLIEITTILCMIFARIGHGPCYYYWNEIFAGVNITFYSKKGWIFKVIQAVSVVI